MIGASPGLCCRVHSAFLNGDICATYSKPPNPPINIMAHSLLANYTEATLQTYVCPHDMFTLEALHADTDFTVKPTLTITTTVMTSPTMTTMPLTTAMTMVTEMSHAHPDMAPLPCGGQHHDTLDPASLRPPGPGNGSCHMGPRPPPNILILHSISARRDGGLSCQRGGFPTTSWSGGVGGPSSTSSTTIRIVVPPVTLGEVIPFRMPHLFPRRGMSASFFSIPSRHLSYYVILHHPGLPVAVYCPHIQ